MTPLSSSFRHNSFVKLIQATLDLKKVLRDRSPDIDPKITIELPFDKMVELMDDIDNEFRTVYHRIPRDSFELYGILFKVKQEA